MIPYRRRSGSNGGEAAGRGASRRSSFQNADVGPHGSLVLRRSGCDLGEQPLSLILRQISDSLTPQRRRCFVTTKQITEKRYVVRLSDEERERIFDGAAEAKLIALACSKPPKGRKRWTLQLLEEQVVELKIVARASDNTIGRTVAVGDRVTPAPRAQIPACGFPAPGSCRRSNAIEVRGFGGPCTPMGGFTPHRQ